MNMKYIIDKEIDIKKKSIIDRQTNRQAEREEGLWTGLYDNIVTFITLVNIVNIYNTCKLLVNKDIKMNVWRQDENIWR